MCPAIRPQTKLLSLVPRTLGKMHGIPNSDPGLGTTKDTQRAIYFRVFIFNSPAVSCGIARAPLNVLISSEIHPPRHSPYISFYEPCKQATPSRAPTTRVFCFLQHCMANGEIDSWFGSGVMYNTSLSAIGIPGGCVYLGSIAWHGVAQDGISRAG